MRVCRVRATGKLIEMQSLGGVAAMTQNAVAAGYAAEDVEVVEVTPAEWATIKAQWVDSDPVVASDASVDREDDAWIAALLGQLPSILDEHQVTGTIDTTKWRNRIRAGVKTLRRPRG